ncbi:unnamed protein product, partial [Pylaiella littoralis]
LREQLLLKEKDRLSRIEQLRANNASAGLKPYQKARPGGDVLLSTSRSPSPKTNLLAIHPNTTPKGFPRSKGCSTPRSLYSPRASRWALPRVKGVIRRSTPCLVLLLMGVVA